MFTLCYTRFLEEADYVRINKKKNCKSNIIVKVDVYTFEKVILERIDVSNLDIFISDRIKK